MGVLDFFKSKVTNYTYAKAMNGYTPIFSQFGDDIYASDIVQSVIQCIVTEMSKLQPMHIKKDGRDSIPVNDDIQRVLNNPNEIMTTSDFISKIMWNLYLNYNSIVYPMWQTAIQSDGTVKRKLVGLYPLQPSQVDFLEDTTGSLYIKMRFGNGTETTMPYSDVIHIKYKYSVNEFMGGNEYGQPDNDALLKLLKMNNSMMDGVLNAMKTSFNINGIIKYNTVLDSKKMSADIEAFNESLKNNESGIMGMDVKSEFVPFTRKIQAVDPETLKFIDTRILRNFGVSMAILTGDYTSAQYQAFYQKVLEPLVISLSQSFSKGLFTQRQKDQSHSITFMPEDLVFLNPDQILETIRLLGDSGGMYENEKRIAVGLPPLAELKGVRMQSLNYVNVDIANKYQVGEGEPEPTGEDDANEK